MLQQADTTQITIVCEPSQEQYAQTAELFTAAGLDAPPNQPDLDRLLREHGDRLDAAFIVTPTRFTMTRPWPCMEAGLDVLLEKPMVLNAGEARSLIAARDRTQRLLVVAFPGSLSPQIRTASALLRSGELGRLWNISATVWQNWAR